MHLKILHFSSGLNMSGAVEKLIFTDLWNRYHQQFLGMKLVEIGAISISSCHHKPLFHCWKDIWCWKLPRHVVISENDRLHIYSLWEPVLCGDTYGESASLPLKLKKVNAESRNWRSQLS
jgi:hypothetical protein